MSSYESVCTLLGIISPAIAIAAIFFVDAYYNPSIEAKVTAELNQKPSRRAVSVAYPQQ